MVENNGEWLGTVGTDEKLVPIVARYWWDWWGMGVVGRECSGINTTSTKNIRHVFLLSFFVYIFINILCLNISHYKQLTRQKELLEKLGTVLKHFFKESKW